MTAKRTLTLLTIAAAAVLLLIPGCLERKETITVDPEGGVRMDLHYSDDVTDFTDGDALPEASTGWEVNDKDTVKDDGSVERDRYALQSFAPGMPLPDSFADPDSPDYAVSLRFPTTVTIESTPEGTFYHFKRVYEPREEARYNVLRMKHKEMFDELDTLSSKEPEEMTETDRARIVEILRVIEAFKRVEFVATGAAAMEDVWPQHYGLLLRQALLDYFEHADVAPLLDLMTEPDTPQRDADIDAFSKKLLADSRDVLQAKLDELGVPAYQADQFFAATDEEETRRKVTEDIGDDSFEISVTLPGKIVAYNGDSSEDNVARWEFPGKALYDCEQVLMATSFLAASESMDPTPPTNEKKDE